MRFWYDVFSCPRIDNEKVCGQRLTSSMPMHPLPALLNNGVPVALCSDDPAVFGNMGLTFDYFQVGQEGTIVGESNKEQVLVSSEITGLSTLGSLARDSIEVGSRIWNTVCVANRPQQVLDA
jgi:adenosine deaminase CECR1